VNYLELKNIVSTKKTFIIMRSPHFNQTLYRQLFADAAFIRLLSPVVTIMLLQKSKKENQHFNALFSLLVMTLQVLRHVLAIDV